MYIRCAARACDPSHHKIVQAVQVGWRHRQRQRQRHCHRQRERERRRAAAALGSESTRRAWRQPEQAIPTLPTIPTMTIPTMAWQAWCQPEQGGLRCHRAAACARGCSLSRMWLQARPLLAAGNAPAWPFARRVCRETGEAASADGCGSGIAGHGLFLWHRSPSRRLSHSIRRLLGILTMAILTMPILDCGGCNPVHPGCNHVHPGCNPVVPGAVRWVPALVPPAVHGAQACPCGVRQRGVRMPRLQRHMYARHEEGS